MANEQDKNPTTGSETDISKAQSQQQPPQQASQQQGETDPRQGQVETGQQDNEELTGDQAATGSSPDAGLQGDTLTQQRTDVEGASLQSQTTGEAQSGFVGAEGEQDTSSELVEDQDFEKDGQGAPEGK
ncbi:MAG: hypothetical protein M3Q19_02995 [Pseudomonadota bacterium]|nr:hypothetical protein [Pseudomonadota bacterium]